MCVLLVTRFTLASRRFWILAAVLIALTAASVVAAVSKSYTAQVKKPALLSGFFYAGWFYIQQPSGGLFLPSSAG